MEKTLKILLILKWSSLLEKKNAQEVVFSDQYFNKKTLLL